MSSDNDIVIVFGPQGRFKLNVPLSDVEALELTAQSFIEAGKAMLLYAKQKAARTSAQKTFDWAAEKVAIPA